VKPEDVEQTVEEVRTGGTDILFNYFTLPFSCFQCYILSYFILFYLVRGSLPLFSFFFFLLSLFFFILSLFLLLSFSSFHLSLRPLHVLTNIPILYFHYFASSLNLFHPCFSSISPPHFNYSTVYFTPISPSYLFLFIPILSLIHHYISCISHLLFIIIFLQDDEATNERIQSQKDLILSLSYPDHAVG
jgi:hypothetical protein